MKALGGDESSRGREEGGLSRKGWKAAQADSAGTGQHLDSSLQGGAGGWGRIFANRDYSLLSPRLFFVLH